MEYKLKRGFAGIVVLIMVLTVVFAFTNASHMVKSPLQNGVYVSERIDVDAEGSMSNLRTSGILGTLDLSLEYSVHRNGLEIKIFSEGELMEKQHHSFTAENNVLVLDNGTRLMVTKILDKYELRYPDHTVLLKRK